MSGQAVHIVHKPTGDDHPYKHYDWERIPRYPTAEEPVTLHATVSGEPSAVWVEWTLGGVRQPDVAATWQAPLPSQPGCWVVRFGPFGAGDEVAYRWAARGEAGECVSDHFAFTAFYWDAPRAVHAASAEGSELSLHFAPKVGPTGGRLRLTAMAGGVLRASLTIGDPTPETRRWSAVIGKTCPAASGWRQTGDTWEISTADYRVRVTTAPLAVKVLNAGGDVLLRDYHLDALRWLTDGSGQIHEVEWSFATPPDEQFWGGGERFDRIARRGTVIDNTVFNQYRDQQDRTYIPVPFLISSRGYGLYADTARIGCMDVAQSAADRLRLSFDGGDAPDAQVDLFVLVAPLPAAVLQTFSSLVGRPELPPSWAFGPWMSANSWDRQSLVEQESRQTLDLDIPTSVLVIEAWSDEITFCIFNDADYEPVADGGPIPGASFRYPAAGRWPDPKGMIDELHRQGIRLVLWQIPVWKRDPSIPSRQKELDEAFLIEHGYVVRNADGTPYRIPDEWFAHSLLIDFTNPEAAFWWQQRRRYLLEELNVDGFKTDGGEFIYPRDVRFADGSRGHEGRNTYANNYIGAAYRLVQEVRGGDGLTFSRAGYTGAQRFPMHWAGDERSTFAAFRSSVIAGLNAGVSGIPFWGWDIAGFSGEVPSAELYVRATAMACFCPVMQYHAETKAVPSQERTPWNIAERTGTPAVIDIYRFYAHLRMNLLPYLYSQARTSAETGLPMMRPLWLMHPEDRATWSMADEYYLGEDLLVAPVIEESVTSRRVYLPKGLWYDFWTNRPQQGPCWIHVAAPWDRIPVFVRAGAALPLEVAEGRSLGEGMGNREQAPKRRVVRLYLSGVQQEEEAVSAWEGVEVEVVRP